MRDTDKVLKKMAQDKKPKSNNSGHLQKNNKKKGAIKASDLRLKLGLGASAVVNFDRLTECLKMMTSKTSKSPCLHLVFKNKEWNPDQDPDKPQLKVSTAKEEADRDQEN